jgi:hypothetical protein
MQNIAHLWSLEMSHELESHISGSPGIGGGERGGGMVGEGGVLAGAFRRQDDGDFGRSRGRERLRIEDLGRDLGKGDVEVGGGSRCCSRS